MSALDRHLAWEACLNVRDLGGLRTREGSSTKRGVLVRASMIGSLTDAGAEAVRAHGVRSVIDLRWPAEVEAQPSIYARGASYRNVAVDSDRELALLDHALNGTMSAQLALLAKPGSGVGAAISAIAEADPAVVIHCQAGRDRTGIVVALLLAAVGVVDDDVAADYCASDTALAAEYARFAKEQPDVAAGIPDAIARRRQVVGQVLRAIHDTYGGPAEYLASAGVARESIDRLRAMLVA